MAADTAIFGFKFGWLFAFLTFLRRFALPLGERRFRRLLAVVLLPLAVLVALGWIEFLLVSHRDLFDRLQFVSDYFVFIAMIGAGIYLRSRSAVLVSRKAAKAILVLAAYSISFFLLLGLWWVIGGSIRQAMPALAAAFNPLVFLLFNGGLAFWVLRFSGVLSGPEAERFIPSRIPEDLSSRFRISRREREIIELVGQGLSNQDIAQSLFISPYTVKKHLNNVFMKTSVANRVQLAALFHFDPGSKGEKD
jgi:DNA-binding CsgD family transcriptional regulator